MEDCVLPCKYNLDFESGKIRTWSQSILNNLLEALPDLAALQLNAANVSLNRVNRS